MRAENGDAGLPHVRERGRGGRGDAELVAHPAHVHHDAGRRYLHERSGQLDYHVRALLFSVRRLVRETLA